MLEQSQKHIIVGVLLLLLLTITGGLTFAQETYSVDIDPANFVESIDNPYYPREVGMRWVYEGQTMEGLERVEIEILSETREVMGVQTTIMRDTVYIDGEIVEDTYDWFAQDIDGNVWYFGEEVSDYENGQLISTAGSWEAGVDGALPGIVMFGDPSSHLGETYLQEYYVGEAEDTAQLLSITGIVEIPFGEFEDILLTYDYTPLDFEAHEIKYFAEDIGEIKSIDLVTGDVVTLIEFSQP